MSVISNVPDPLLLKSDLRGIETSSCFPYPAPILMLKSDLRGIETNLSFDGVRVLISVKIRP